MIRLYLLLVFAMTALVSCGTAQSTAPTTTPCDSLVELLPDADQSIVVGFYEAAAEDYLITQRDTSAYYAFRACYQAHAASLSVPFQQAVNFRHHYQLGRYAYMQNLPDLAAIQLDSAYQLRPDHAGAKELLHDHIFLQIQPLVQTADYAQLGTYLREKADQYPFLLEDPKFQELLVFTSTERE